jgi:hypothetical protein
MRRLVFAFGLILGCDEAPPPPPPPVVVEAAQEDSGGAEAKAEAKSEPEKPPRTAAEAAHDLLVAGKASEALTAAQALEDKPLGERLVEAAILAGATMPAGADPLLVIEAKLRAGDAQGAFDGAKDVLGTGESDAAVLLVRAVKAGAVAPEDFEMPEAAAALLKWAQSSDARRARGHVAKAAVVSGWRADLFRAEIAEGWGDTAGAIAAHDALASSKDPRARIAGLLGKLAQQRAGKRKGVSESEQAQWAAAAHKIALAEGTADQVSQATRLVVDTHKQTSAFADVLAFALQSKVLADAAGVDAAEAGIFAANAALHLGDPVQASVLANAVMVANADPESVSHQRAAWVSGLAAFALARTDELDKAAAACRGPQKDALKALAAFNAGDVETARLQFPPSGLSGEDAALVYGQAALTDAAAASKWYDKAISGADKSGIDTLRLSTRFAKESHLRSYDRKGAAAVRRDIAKLLNKGDAVAGELAVRSLLAGTVSPIPVGSSPGSEVWMALAEKRMPKKVDGVVWEGLLHWARGRAAAAAGRLEGHDGQFPAALGKLPLHRMGRLDLGTVFDGSEGVDLETDVTLLQRVGGEMATGLALSAHDIGHRLDTLALNLSQGMMPLYGVDDETREALMVATAKARADTSRWWMGQVKFPTEAYAAVSAAEAKAAGNSMAFKSMMPAKGSTAQDLLSDLRRGAVLSYRASHGSIQAIALSREGNGIKDLGSTREIYGYAKAYRQAMMAAALEKKGKTNHSHGHMLRTRLIDPFVAELTGVGRYAVVGPPELVEFPFTTMPEQAEGLRWLADIRQMASAPTVGILHRELREVTADTYKLDFLAFGGEKEAPKEHELTNFETPDELAVCGRHFRGGFDEVLTGEKATLASWAEKASGARYIHFAEVRPSMNGGFQLHDGALSLDQVRNTPIHAEMVVITARTTPEQQLRRARAFLDAGARWVLVAGWEVPDKVRVKYLANIYDSMNQERPPVRAMSEGRNKLFNDALMGIDLDDPALWGVFTLFGKP